MKRLLYLLLLGLSPAMAAPQPLLGLRAEPTPDYLREHYAALIPSGTGLSVVDTVAKTPAAEVLKDGDIILSINAKPVGKKEELAALMQECKPGDVLQLRVLRLGEVIELSLTLASRPEQPTLNKEQTSELNRLLLLLCPPAEEATVDVPAVRRHMLKLAEMGLADKDEYDTCTLYLAAGETLIRIKSSERSLTIRNNHPKVPDAYLRAGNYTRDDERLHEKLTELLLQADYYRP